MPALVVLSGLIDGVCCPMPDSEGRFLLLCLQLGGGFLRLARSVLFKLPVETSSGVTVNSCQSARSQGQTLHL